MPFTERIQKSFGIFGRDDPNAKYGVFEILGENGKLVSSGNKESCESRRIKLEQDLAKKTPRYVVRKLTNLWSFSSKIDRESYSCWEVLNNLQDIIDNSKNKKLVDAASRMKEEFESLCKSQKIINFSIIDELPDRIDKIKSRRDPDNIENFEDLSEVETKWEPPDNLFAEGSADEIAKEVHKSHDSLKSAISCLNFYLNRGGDNISEDRKKVIEDAKDKIREMYD